MAYSIDISYYITDNSENKDDHVFEITGKYNDCNWYASDSGPHGTNNNTERSMNHGFHIESLDTLKNIIKEVNAHPFLWIDFCTKSIDNGNDCEHIYYSDMFLPQIIPSCREAYNEKRESYFGVDKEIYDLCMADTKN